jgi:hypothetical protein
LSNSLPENNELYDELLFSGVASQATALQIAQERRDRLILTQQVLTGIWKDHLIKPAKLPKPIWRGLVCRFKLTDLATPVLETIINASHGCKITRKIKKCFNQKQVEDYMERAMYSEFVKMAAAQTIGYGTGYPTIGFRKDSDAPSLTLGPNVLSFIHTPEDDVNHIEAVEMHWDSIAKKYTDNGVFKAEDGGEFEIIPDTDYGFRPVSIWRGRHLDPSTPYGGSYIWPAVDESRQVTYIDCDLMVLEKTQSFGVLVTKGTPEDTKSMEAIGPFSQLRYTMNREGQAGDAKFISPDGKIDSVNNLIESKFERAAVMCRVPVSIFTRERSGTNQGTGATAMQHRPLYDLVVSIQEACRYYEMDLIARIDAMFSWKNTGEPQDLDKHRQNLEMEISYDRDAFKRISMQDAQTLEMLLSSCLLTHEKAYYCVNEDEGTETEQKALETKREQRMMLDSPSGNLSPSTGNQQQQPAKPKAKPAEV